MFLLAKTGLEWRGANWYMYPKSNQIFQKKFTTFYSISYFLQETECIVELGLLGVNEKYE